MASFRGCLVQAPLLVLCLTTTTTTTAISIFDTYPAPTTSTWFRLDLDQRSIVAQTARTNAQGLAEATVVYQHGDPTTTTTTTLQSLSGVTTTTTPRVYTNHSTFDGFATFYGHRDTYADLVLRAALEGTPLVRKDDTLNFARLHVKGRANAVRWIPVVLHVWMAVVGALEQALALTCTTTTSSTTTTALQSWDDAFALYTGSQAESDLPLGGYFLFALAQTQCLVFGTCRAGDEAPVNTEMIRLFVQGKQSIVQSSSSSSATCDQLPQTVERMKALVKVPVLQAALRSLYAMDREDDHRPEVQGAAAAFGTAVAPMVSLCSQGSADRVWTDLTPPSQHADGGGRSAPPTGSFEVVKAAVERHYECLGVTCADMGGIIALRADRDGYLDRAEACDGVQPVAGAGVQVVDGTSNNAGDAGGADRSSSSSSGSSTNGVALGVFLAVALVALVLGGRRVYQTRNQKESDSATKDSEEPASGDDDGDDDEETMVQRTDATLS